ncbi:MAG: hypothetical protein ACYSU5_25625 [Planctomycetota bacterium]
MCLLIQSVQSILHILEADVGVYVGSGGWLRATRLPLNLPEGSPEASISPGFRDSGVNWGVNCEGIIAVDSSGNTMSVR